MVMIPHNKGCEVEAFTSCCAWWESRSRLPSEWKIGRAAPCCARWRYALDGERRAAHGSGRLWALRHDYRKLDGIIEGTGNGKRLIDTYR
ncbi:hypothetical protein FA13DRAFT_66429 [Coprinellus micaceus]|uniref:Uncharacterized protein n=1 Tax=Coprinellus micaceus TaxID=71717 RepID=A0A4Y7TKQ7_COPMI|nr:hypothetical protein FA13DRAFT_66429 [Coprinellus micaceus]